MVMNHWATYICTNAFAVWIPKLTHPIWRLYFCFARFEYIDSPGSHVSLQIQSNKWLKNRNATIFTQTIYVFLFSYSLFYLRARACVYTVYDESLQNIHIFAATNKRRICINEANGKNIDEGQRKTIRRLALYLLTYNVESQLIQLRNVVTKNVSSSMISTSIQNI